MSATAIDPLFPFFVLFFFFFNDTATTEIYTLSLHDALPISTRSEASAQAFDRVRQITRLPCRAIRAERSSRSEEHTSELQSHDNLVCRLLLEKKKQKLHHVRGRATLHVLQRVS